MQRQALDVICCPWCKSNLVLEQAEGEDGIHSGGLQCKRCAKSYPINEGIPQFVARNELVGKNKSAYWIENINAHFYDLIVKAMTSYFGISEEEGRKEYLCRLELGSNAKILEVSVGTGANIPYLLRYGSRAEFYGLDLSPGMLAQCAKNVQKWACKAELFHGLAERLPFRDGSFDVVFHVGGINAFEDKKRAIEEMMRVSKLGTRIVIVDEWLSPTRLTRLHERLLLRVFPAIARRTEPPMDLIPESMVETKLEAIWNGYGYCLEFRKPVQPQVSR